MDQKLPRPSLACIELQLYSRVRPRHKAQQRRRSTIQKVQPKLEGNDENSASTLKINNPGAGLTPSYKQDQSDRRKSTGSILDNQNWVDRRKSTGQQNVQQRRKSTVSRIQAIQTKYDIKAKSSTSARTPLGVDHGSNGSPVDTQNQASTSKGESNDPNVITSIQETDHSIEERFSKKDQQKSEPLKKAKAVVKKKKRPTSRQSRISEGEAASRKQTKLQKAIKLFVESVSITGLETLYRSRILAEKCLWYMSYILAFTGIGFTSISILKQYQDPPIVYDRTPIYGIQAPFPNVSVCGPAATDRAKLRQRLIIPQKVENLIKRKHLNRDEIIDTALDFARLDMRSIQFGDMVTTLAAFKILDASAPGGWTNMVSEAIPGCSIVFSNCYFEGNEFDCCHAAQWQVFDGQLCFQLSLDRLPEMKRTLAAHGGPKADTIHEKDSGLEFTVSIDWQLTSFFENLASSGFLLFIGELAFPFAVPVALPSGADALVTLAPPKKVKEKSQCQPNEKLPQLRFYEYYDPHGFNCMFDKVLEQTRQLANCELMSFGRKPKNGSECSSEATMTAIRAFCNPPDQTQDIEELITGSSMMATASGDTKERLERLGKMKEAMVNFQANILKDCLPLCSRWLYPINSASYGYVQFHGQDQWDQPLDQNRSWSSIRAFFPESSYQLQVEKATLPGYMAVCEVGGVIGVYLGASMITIIQFFAYGAIVAYFFVKHVANRRKAMVRIAPAKLSAEYS